MIAQDIRVTFKFDSGNKEMAALCDRVVFLLEVGGEVVEYLDRALDEIDISVRQVIELQVKLDLAKADFMADFIGATDKVLVIDGIEFDVVNGFSTASFSLFRGRQRLGVHPTLRFRRRAVGIAGPHVLTGDIESGTEL